MPSTTAARPTTTRSGSVWASNADPPAGVIFHTAGFTGTGLFRIFDVWESEDAWQRFRDERLMPAVQAVAQGAPPPVEYTYELHDFVTP